MNNDCILLLPFEVRLLKRRQTHSYQYRPKPSKLATKKREKRKKNDKLTKLKRQLLMYGLTS